MATHLAGALSAAVHRPLIFVLVHDAVVDANATVDVDLIFQQSAVLRLWGDREREGGVAQDGGWKTFTLPTFQDK